jgi:outer membrane lipoprotein SlyB
MTNSTIISALATLSLSLTSLPALADLCKPECGKVISVQSVEKEGKGSALGVVAGGVAGALLGNQIGGGSGKTVATIGGAAGGAYLGNMAEKKYKAKTVKKVTVTLDNGNSRTFELDDSAQIVKGDRVQITEGVLNRYSGK